MKFVFVSNYINHHQKPFCDALYEKLGDEFAFVATMPMEAERVSMGWDNDLSLLPYVKLLYEDAQAEQLIYDADCVLFGWSEREDIVQKRLISGKPSLRVSERLYRDGRYKAISPKGLVAKYHEHIKFRRKPIYMLCAGAYTAADFSLIKAYPDKCLKWGYYPPFRSYEDGELARIKSSYRDSNDGKIQIVWAGRFIPLKHAEYMIMLAEDLKKRDIPFHIHMVGAGELEKHLKNMANAKDVTDDITWYGFKKPDEVRDIMEKCEIHLCTSNQLEGWGAVVNEGMNSGCAEVISDRMGVAPFLIEQGVNGFTYAKDNYESLRDRVIELIENDELRRKMSVNAYETIRDEWNASVAAGRLLDMIEELVRAWKIGVEPKISLPLNGPLSKAKNIKLK